MEDIFGRLYFGATEMNHTHVIFTKKGQVAEHIQLDTAYTEFKNIQKISTQTQFVSVCENHLSPISNH